MLNGILLGVGVIFGLFSRCIYATYDLEISGDSVNSLLGIFAIVFDVSSLCLILGSLGNHYGLF